MLCYFVLVTRPAWESDIARAGVRFDAFLSERADPLGVGVGGVKSGLEATEAAHEAKGCACIQLA